jgi:hypothetical protein
VICVYLFDSIFNEANESSSACEPGIELHVETNTPPMGCYYTGKGVNSKEAGAISRTAVGIPLLQDRLSWLL